MRRKLALLLIAVMLIATLTACGGGGSETPSGGESEPAEEKVLVVRASSDPVSLNPDGSADDAAFNVVGNVFSQLVRLDANRDVIPDLAESWESSEDGLTITFHLVKNAKWHDGEPVTAEDVAYTFNYILTHDTCLMNARFKPQIESVEATDDYTAVFHMINPYAELIGRLGYYATFIVPKHIMDNGQEWNDNPAAQAPIGSGPFKFVEWNPGENIILEKNEEYFKGEVKLDKLIFRQIPDDATAYQSLLSGEIDYLSSVPGNNTEELQANSDFVMNLNVLPSPTYIAFNFNEGPTAELAVRQAIAYCINREEISDKVFSGIRAPEYNFYPSVIKWVSNSDCPAPSYDPAKAVEILEAAGYEKDANGYYVKDIDLECFSSDSSPDVAKLVKAGCEEAGIGINVNVEEYQAWNTKVHTDHDFDIFMQGGFQGPDVAALSGRVGTNGASNAGGYSNEEVDKLFAEGLLSVDQEVRAPIYKKIQEIMSQDLPLLPIVQYATYTAQASYVVDTPIQCAGKSGWTEYFLTDIQK